MAVQMVLGATRIVTVPGAGYWYKARGNSLMTRRKNNDEFRRWGHQARDEVNGLLQKLGVRHSADVMPVMDYRLFGRIRLFTVVAGRDVRLFGQLRLFKITKHYRKI